MERNLTLLKADYKEDKIVPFIGAGLSKPFGVPTWKELIEHIADVYSTGSLLVLKQTVNLYLERFDYWGAIKLLKDLTPIVDQDIQKEIVRLMREKPIELEDDSLHNYSDLCRLNFNLYLTTNYEHLLSKYLESDYVPIELQSTNFSTQDLFNEKRICHLHGHISNPGNIVISQESYERLYNDKKYDNLLKLVTGTKKLLFLGFSFDDQFIRTLIQNHKEYFNGNHYILVNNPTPEKMKEFREDYGLITIGYNAESSSHEEEIRKILSFLEEDEENLSATEMTAATSLGETIILGATIMDTDRNLQGNLFYKKLVLENIEPTLIELSSLFYVAAEIYIRDLKKSGMNIEVINAILFNVLMEYQEEYANTYKKYGNSQQFLEVVHSSLENIDFGRLKAAFKEHNKSNEKENKGFIHILADDSTKKIWWGEKRL
ncbi:ABC-three component system protein [Lysinibacillus telephonicus]|uniref:ABC-three component system protein n=1 Tax=Lysinibacillus telephonicus TaxID=1714840 RepID=UPI0031FC6A74